MTQEVQSKFDELHIWFCKAPTGAVVFEPLKLDPLTL